MAFAVLFVFVSPAYAQAPIVPITQPVPAVKSIDTLITEYSAKWGVKRSVVASVIDCESGGNPNAVGDNGHSFGLVQVFLPAHPNISKAQALDAEFSIDYLAKELSLKHGDAWTCYRQLSSSP